MDFDFSGFGDFEASSENIEIKKAKKFDRIWHIGKSGGSVYQKPTIENGIIYFGSLDSYVYAVESETGQEIWRVKLDEMVLGSCPVIIDDVIYIGGYDLSVYAIDKIKGKIIWKFKTGGGVFSTIGHSSGKLYFGSSDGFLYCINLKGQLVWRFKTGGEIPSSPSIIDDKIIFGSFDNFYYCLDANTGGELWKFRTGAEVWHVNKLPVMDGKIFCPSFDNFVYCLSLGTGKELWRFKTGKYGSASAPVIHDGLLYHGCRDGIVYCLNFDGKEMWRFQCGEAMDSGTGYKDMFLFCNGDGNLYAVDAKTGKELWRYHTGTVNYHHPAVWNDKIFFSSWDCHIYAVDIEGNALWRFATSVSKESEIPPTYDAWEAEIKKSSDVSDTIDTAEKYSGAIENLNLSEYGTKSEYAGKSEYTHKSEYTTDFVIFEDCMNFGVNEWTSGLKDSVISLPPVKISR